MRINKLVASAMLVGAAFTQAGTAVAAPQSYSPDSTGWKRGCTSTVCVYARYNGHGWDAFGTFVAHESYGHLDVFGPDHRTHHSGGDRPWGAQEASITFSGTGSGNVCAQGWHRRPDNSYQSVGLACVDM
ncbi:MULTISPECIES: hypothetical protein [Kribbella]|uniref:Peptidase inhibitor family I36 n=1 Tax=Kribbella karoonensis TaxID=324851 RepID=A0ABP4Q3G0_9ACTN